MIRHFKAGDLEKINRQERQLLEGDGKEFDNADTVVFEYEGKVLAMMRPIFYDEGCILAALISKDSKPYAIKLFKDGKRFINGMKDFCDFIEMSTQVGWLEAERLARALGFEPDRLMKNFYNGMDFNVWRLK